MTHTLNVSDYRAKEHAAAFTTDYTFNQLIPYLGNKRKLLGLIEQAIEKTGVHADLFVDFFAGSGVVARFAKQRGFCVLANDWEPYAHILNHAFIACNVLPDFGAVGGVAAAFQALNAAGPVEDYVTSHLCPRSDERPDPDTERLFFTRANGMRIDAMRETIANWEQEGRLTGDERAILLAALLYSVSYVSNTSGLFKGFHRGWGGATKTALYRILSDIQLRPPVLCDNHLPNEASQMDATVWAEWLCAQGRQIDIAYLDPPYNQHPYGSNYHVLNTVALWDKPAVPPRSEGRHKSAIRTDWRTERRSAYNHATALGAYEALLHAIPARFILTSYSTDGNMPLDGLLQAAAGRGLISCVTRPYKRFRVSSQRMSARPVNVEFILTIDTRRPSPSGASRRLQAQIESQEADCLAARAASNHSPKPV